MFDVIVVGGGSSGLMAAVSASQAGARVIIIEKNNDLGRKLLLTGGGRCNITNNRPAEEIVKHIPGNGKFLYSAFSQFDNYDIINFFKENGVELKEEDHGRMFPISDKARTILETFITLINKEKITVQTQSSVKQLTIENNQLSGVELTTGEIIKGRTVILATGGKSIPRTGSTGDGYPMAQSVGHTITPLFPTEVPLTSNEDFIKDRTLQGLSLQNIALSVLNGKQKPLVTHEMDMIFTHFGISGPAVLRCSSFVYKQQVKSTQSLVTMHLDCLPHLTVNELTQRLQEIQKNTPQKEMKTILKDFIPERLALFFLKTLQIASDSSFKTISANQLTALVLLLKGFTFTVNGSLPIDKSFVTGGGVKTSEIYPQTMMSKLMPGLFFCGELLDIHGYTGGYNITSAFVTGFLAGKHAAAFPNH